MMDQKCVAVISGGLDSTTMLHELHSRGYQLVGLSFDYGQRHKKELQLAAAQCSLLGVEHIIIDLSDLGKKLNSCLTQDQPVPEGHYEDANMKSTVVPNRNMIMASIAAGIAISRGFNIVAMGMHQGDHAIYPDCRRTFVNHLDTVFRLCHYTEVSLYTPYINMKKEHIVLRGQELKVPYANTWSCYNGRETHCGKCGTCVERKEAFALAKVPDPTEYEVA